MANNCGNGLLENRYSAALSGMVAHSHTRVTATPFGNCIQSDDDSNFISIFFVPFANHLFRFHFNRNIINK